MLQHQKNSGIQVIARAADILRTLAKHPEGMSLAQIAGEVALARSTVQRIVNALQTERFVVPIWPNGRVRLGPGLAALTMTIHGDLRVEIRPFIERLSQSVNETVDLAILDENQVLFVDQVSVPQRLQAASAEGSRFPLHCTANGKAILSLLSDEEILQMSPDNFPQYTMSTITSMEQLMSEINLIRQRGYAYDCEEHTLGICAVGSAFRTIFGELAAITIPVPATRFFGEQEKLTSALLETCQMIRQKVGMGS